MQVDRSLRRCSIAATGVAALTITTGVVAGALTSITVGAIVFGEVFALAILIVFTVLIWAAIQDGKHEVFTDFER